jgi:hypothetical protein
MDSPNLSDQRFMFERLKFVWRRKANKTAVRSACFAQRQKFCHADMESRFQLHQIAKIYIPACSCG